MPILVPKARNSSKGCAVLETIIAVLGPVAFLSAALCAINRHFRTLAGFRNPALPGVVTNAAHLELTGPTIGRWGDFPLHEFVVVDGRRFTYDRLVGPDYRYRVSACELFVEPGMV